MPTLISLVTVAIEDAVRESTLVNSKRGTVRNIARAITSAVEGDAASYDAVKEAVSTFYDTHPLDTSPADAVKGMSGSVTTALLSVVASRPAADAAPVSEPEPVAPETPTVENLTAVLVDLGKTAESAPEYLNDSIQKALQRFGLN